MKDYIFFTLCFVLIILSSCTDTKNDDPKPQIGSEAPKSDFKIVYTQSGDIENFIKTISLPKGIVFDSSGTEAPMAINNDKLTLNKYVLRTKDKVESLEIGISSGWLPTTKNPSAMDVKLEVFRDGNLIDTQNLKFTSSEVSDVFQFKYEAE